MPYTPLRTGDSDVDRNLDLIKAEFTVQSSTTASRQVEIGQVQTAIGTVASATFAPPSNTLSLKIKALSTGLYKVATSGFQMWNSTAGGNISAKLIAILGNVDEVLPAQVVVDTTASFGANLNFTYVLIGYYNLIAGTTYEFQLQGKTDAGTVTFYFPTLPAAIIAEQLQ